jgi:hypothetical protein
MWINIQNQRVNFDNVLKYYVEDSELYIVNLVGLPIIYYYNSATKAKQVVEYLDSKFTPDKL